MRIETRRYATVTPETTPITSYTHTIRVLNNLGLVIIRPLNDANTHDWAGLIPPQEPILFKPCCHYICSVLEYDNSNHKQDTKSLKEDQNC